MANLENGCRWHFGAEGGTDFGPTDPMKGTFKSTPEINVVREAIQNSLDAKLRNATGPVRVSFRLSRLSSAEFPAFFELRDHICAALDYYKSNRRANEKFPRMIRALSAAGGGAGDPPAPEIGVLSIGDRNTTGMAYRAGDTGCPFYAFFQSIGVSAAKGEGSGGSNGLGKNTLFAFSSVKALVVSSKTEDGSVVFQGKSELATHLAPDGSGKKVSKFGVYGLDEREPVTDESLVPVPFRRNEAGTDIHIVGVDDSNPDALRDELVRAVLNHFWLSIRDGMLEVDILGTVLSQETLAEQMRLRFPDGGAPEGKPSNFTKWNPVPYWRAVEHAEGGAANSAREEEILPHAGRCVVFLDWNAGDLPRRVVFMRKPRMSIFKQGKLAYPPFAAVFVCLDDKGNDLLKDTEPPDHASWDAVKNYEGDDMTARKHAISEVEDFVKRILDKHLRTEASRNEILIPGLAELLPDMKDERERKPAAEHGTVGSGSSDGLKPSGELSDSETAAALSFIDPATGAETVPGESIRRGEANGLVEDVAPDENGNPATTFQSDENEGDNPSPAHGPQPAGTPAASAITPTPGENATILVHVTTRVGAHRKNGSLWHRIVVRPAPGQDPEQCSSVRLSFYTGSDNGKPDPASVVEAEIAPAGSFDSATGAVVGVDLCCGAKIDVRFNDSVLHSVKVVAHASVR